jgi:hypothetical protein
MKGLKEHLNESLQQERVDEGLMDWEQVWNVLWPILYVIYYRWINHRGSVKDAWYKIRGLIDKENIMTMKTLKDLIKRAALNNSVSAADMKVADEFVSKYGYLYDHPEMINQLSDQEKKEIVDKAPQNIVNAMNVNTIDTIYNSSKKSSVDLWRNCRSIIIALCNAPNRSYDETKCLIEVIDKILEGSRRTKNILNVPDDWLSDLFELRDALEVEMVEYDQAGARLKKSGFPSRADFRDRKIKVSATNPSN